MYILWQKLHFDKNESTDNVLVVKFAASLRPFFLIRVTLVNTLGIVYNQNLTPSHNTLNYPLQTDYYPLD